MYTILYNGEKQEINSDGWLDFQPVGCMDNLERVIGEKMDYERNVNPDYYRYSPFDIVLYKPKNEEGIVKRVTRDGVFVLFRIQSTPAFCKFEDIEKV